MSPIDGDTNSRLTPVPCMLTKFIYPLLLLAASSSAFASGQLAPGNAPISCDVGPVSRVYGNTHWLAYACSDGKSLALISAKDNPACPAYFIVSPRDGRYTVTGQGSGNKDTIPAVEKELRSLSPADIAATLKEAAAGASNSK